MVAAAHGGDGAGSIRIPASCCGVFGLKPTRGRITLGPDLGDSTGSIVNEHVLSMTVRDSAALLDLTQGPMLGDPYAAPPPTEAYLSQIARPPKVLRIALTTRSLLGTEVHPDCVEAVVKTAKLCEDLGHTVTIDAPEIDGELYCRTYVRFWAMTATRAIASIALRQEARAEELAPETEAFNQYLFSIGSTVSAAEYLLNLGWFHSVGRSIARFLGKYDVWLTPTLGTPPPVLGHFDAEIHGGETVMSRFLEFLSFTTFANMAGLPAMSVPLFWNSDNLPVGSQFTSGVNQEGLLLRLAAQLEQAQPWRHRTPPVTVARATFSRGTLS
jgi:amidase